MSGATHLELEEREQLAALNQSMLHPVGTHPDRPTGDVVFVHGLGGWRSPA